MIPTIIAVDHIHLSVKNRSLSEQWYKDIFGFERVAELETWATDNGPLTLGNALGNIHLALFESDKVQNTVVAFSVTGIDFFNWIEHLREHDISVKPIDHNLSWSIYFRDPDGNPFELTTYDCAYVTENITV